MPGGDAERQRILLLLHLGPKPEPSLKTEVKEVTGSKGQRSLSQQLSQTGSPSFQHLRAHGGGTVGRTPEDLRSQNLESTEVQNAVLKGSKHGGLRILEVSSLFHRLKHKDAAVSGGC